MDKTKKNRSGSLSNESDKNQGGGGRRRDSLQGTPARDNRQTGGSKRRERDESSRSSDRLTTKKGPNAV
jgi:hypothetical protein